MVAQRLGERRYRSARFWRSRIRFRTTTPWESLPVSFPPKPHRPAHGCSPNPPARITPSIWKFVRCWWARLLTSRFPYAIRRVAGGSRGRFAPPSPTKPAEPYDSPSSQPEVMPLCASAASMVRRVIVSRPRERARVGSRRARPAPTAFAKAADERPIAVQAGQIKSAWAAKHRRGCAVEVLRPSFQQLSIRRSHWCNKETVRKLQNSCVGCRRGWMGFKTEIGFYTRPHLFPLPGEG